MSHACGENSVGKRELTLCISHVLRRKLVIGNGGENKIHFVNFLYYFEFIVKNKIHFLIFLNGFYSRGTQISPV
jgi:hypothetical protein